MQTFTISLFRSVGDNTPQMVKRTWPELCAKFATPVVRQEKDGWLFSPANYRHPRRLIANVTELSLLVLEVDGAWKCDGCGHKAPLIMFRNAKHEGDRCQPCHKAKVTEPHSISRIEFDLAALITDVRQAFNSAFAIYSTHSHRHVTEKNPLAEPHFRIVVPLTSPVPVNQFGLLWELATCSLALVPVDPQIKNPNGIYYTPAIFCDEAPYEYHIEPGEPLDWKKIVGNSTEQTAETVETGAASVGLAKPLRPAVDLPSAVSSAGDIYASHEARHAELCRRIMARGRQNSRGNYDARCLAHGGKGTTAILYNPIGGAVSCNRGCDYFDLLAAEGLETQKLPSAEFAAARQLATAGTTTTTPVGNTTAEAPMQPAVAAVPLIGPKPVVSLAKLHTINSLLLAHLFELTDEDEKVVRRYWGDPFNEEIEWPGTDNKQRVKVCSFPSRRLQLEAAQKLSQVFALEGVPGFYRFLIGLGSDRLLRQAEHDEFGPWRVALDQYRMRPGALLSPFDNGSGYICGIRIHRAIRDKCPFLLTSTGLPGGSKAIAYREVAA